ncbi:MAG: DUF4143 domain-containing protein [Bacteroidales bacterium]|nr:DUF4143 domain-containing protein [Bacteroidales bacterium]
MYYKRISDVVLQRKLQTSGVVVIEGTKWCGKTSTAEQIAKSAIYINDPSKNSTYIQLAETDPQLLLSGDTPRLIDEWQDAPQLWDAARFEADHREEMGQWIFTGSAVPKKENEGKIRHSGTGRFSWMTMRTMSLFESNDSGGEISLKDLFDNTAKSSIVSKKKDIRELAFLICRGGWPALFKTKKENVLDLAYNYVEAVVKYDISRVDGVKRDVSFAQRLLRSMARHQGSQASMATIHDDLSAGGESSMTIDTITSYLNALKQIFVIENAQAWNPNLRSKSAIRTSDTHYFVDPSIGAAALGIGPTDLINDIETLGLLFETLCIRDLRVYADALNGTVYHFRDRNGLECDAVVHLRNGHYGLVEVKLGGSSAIESAAKTLKSLSDKIDTTKMPVPSFCMILTGVGEFAYQRTDGIWVVPVGCLRP